MEIKKLKGKRGVIAGLFALFAAALSAQNLNQIELSSGWQMQYRKTSQD